MKTEFQRKLVKDKETLWTIVKIFHPDIPETFETKNGPLSVKDNKLCAYLKYDWVCIEFRIKSFGVVSLGIDNCHQWELFGPKITKNMMQKALNDGTCKFHVWRFTRDEMSAAGQSKELEAAAIDILKKAGYSLQSVSEMYKIYYED